MGTGLSTATGIDYLAVSLWRERPIKASPAAASASSATANIELQHSPVMGCENTFFTNEPAELPRQVLIQIPDGT